MAEATTPYQECNGPVRVPPRTGFGPAWLRAHLAPPWLRPIPIPDPVPGALPPEPEAPAPPPAVEVHEPDTPASVFRSWLRDLLTSGLVARHAQAQAEADARELVAQPDPSVSAMRSLCLSVESSEWPHRYAAAGLALPDPDRGAEGVTAEALALAGPRESPR